MYDDITQYFSNLIRQTGSYDIARAEFQRIVAEDDELHESYANWCYENGLNERDGFDEFCNGHINDRNSVWESLNDFDE